MSTNTTSTSDRVEAGVASVPVDEGARAYENPFADITSLPDPVVIARLANEFFAALPRSPEPQGGSAATASPAKMDSVAVSALAPPTPLPDAPDSQRTSPTTVPPSFPPVNEMFAFPGVPGVASPPSFP